MRRMPNKVMLITYPDSMDKNLAGLHAALAKHLDGALPFQR